MYILILEATKTIILWIYTLKWSQKQIVREITFDFTFYCHIAQIYCRLWKFSNAEKFWMWNSSTSEPPFCVFYASLFITIVFLSLFLLFDCDCRRKGCLVNTYIWMYRFLAALALGLSLSVFGFDITSVCFTFVLLCDVKISVF